MLNPSPLAPRRVYAIPPLGRLYERLGTWSWPLVRLALGAPLIPHGVHKLSGLVGVDLGRSAGFFETTDAAFGPLLSYTLAMTEIVGGLLVIVGYATRPAALMLALFFLISTLRYWPGGYFWTDRGFEYPLVLFALALAVMIRGGGEHSVDRRLRVEF